MSYGQLAYLYDELMKDVPYSEWIHLFSEQLQKYSVSGKNVLDLACGTGEISVRLAKAGFNVTGIDLSDEMLSVAYAKASSQGLSIPFYQQDMSRLEGIGQFDAITIFCDSLNYLKEPEDIKATFEKVFLHLDNDGLFIFDVHSPFKMEKIFHNATFAHNNDDISYIWNCFPGDERLSVEHELSFFVLDPETGKYDRFEEIHFQRTFSPDVYQEWLNEAGFELLDMIYDLDESKGFEPEAERLCFIARKRK